MGWTYTKQTREALIADLLSDQFHHTVQHALIEDHLWVVKEHVRNGALRRYITVFLLDCSNGWNGYKEIDESMGPVALDCPLEFIDLVDSQKPIGYAAAWRAHVRTFHATRASARDLLAPSGPSEVREDRAIWARRWFDGDASCPRCASDSDLKPTDLATGDSTVVETWACGCGASWRVELREQAVAIEPLDGRSLVPADWIERDPVECVPTRTAPG